MPRDDAQAADALIMIMERHMSEEERLPVCMAFAFGDQEKLRRILLQLFDNKLLTVSEVVRELKRVPVLLRSMELPS